MFDDLIEINRNKNGDYYFIYSVKDVKNHINTKAKPRSELLIIGVPKSQLVSFLNGQAKGEGIKFNYEKSKTKRK